MSRVVPSCLHFRISVIPPTRSIRIAVTAPDRRRGGYFGTSLGDRGSPLKSTPFGDTTQLWIARPFSLSLRTRRVAAPICTTTHAVEGLLESSPASWSCQDDVRRWFSIQNFHHIESVTFAPSPSRHFIWFRIGRSLTVLGVLETVF